MDKIKESEFVQYYVLSSEKETLLKELEASVDVSEKKNNIDKEIAKLEEQLAALLVILSDEDLNSKIFQIRSDKAEIAEIIKNLDIEDRITSFENQHKTLLDSIFKMRKKKHSIEYKRQLLQENLVEALKNVEPLKIDSDSEEN
jgi:hypothetical protein